VRAQRSEMAQPRWYAIVLTLFVRLICIWRSGNDIEEIPEFFTSLRNLEVLNLSCEFTRYWITWMCTWADRTNETANSIKRIDESFALLQNLKLLYLSGSVFDAFAHHSISFCNWNAICDVAIPGCKLRSIPSSITKPVNLEALFLDGFSLFAFDKWAHLHSDNRITSVPDSIADLINLQELFIYGSFFPVFVFGTWKAKHQFRWSIIFTGNRISSVPVAITRLPKLQKLCIYSTRINFRSI
jgi:Leucine-rich repeat (LRR) protein